MKEGVIYLYGDIGGDITPKSVTLQLAALDECDTLLLKINSYGGDVSQGFAIYDILSQVGKPIHTHVEGVCYSIAVILQLLGEKRIINEHSEIGIHDPFVWLHNSRLKAGDMLNAADVLTKTKENILNVYTTKTNLSKEQAEAMMKGTTIMSASVALQNGFVTEIKKSNTITQNILNQFSTMERSQFKKMFDEFQHSCMQQFNKLMRPKNMLIQDANGTEIDFYELKDDETPSVGDKAKIGGKEAEGKVVLANGDTFVFEKGVLTEIIKKEEEGNTEQLKAENRMLTEKLAKAEQENMSLKADQVKTQNALQSLYTEFNTMKSLIGSTFNYTPELEAPKGNEVGNNNTPQSSFSVNFKK